MSLRPEIRVTHNYITPTPAEIETNLIPCIIGINRLQVYQGSAGTFTGGLPAVTYEFPDYIDGAVIEDTSSTLDITGYTTVLRPVIQMSTNYGIGTVDNSYITYSLSADPPTFIINPNTILAIFTAIGTTGAYSSSTGKFSDVNADFIIDEVKAADKIYIKNANDEYVYELDVTSLVDEDELNVTRHNKAVTGAVNADLTANDSNLRRTLTAATQTFETNDVGIYDQIIVRGFAELMERRGGTFGTTALITTPRTFTDTEGSFSTIGLAGGEIVYYDRAGLGLVPCFYVSGAPTSDVTMSVLNADKAVSPVPAIATTESNRAYDFRTLGATGRNLIFGGGPTYKLADGNYTAVTGGDCTFTSAGATFNAGTITVGDIVVIQRDGTEGASQIEHDQGNYPEFRVKVVAPGADTTKLTLTAIDASRHPEGDIHAGADLKYSIYSEAVVVGGTMYGASWTGGTLTAYDNTIDFDSAPPGGYGVAVNDYIKDRTGTYIGKVTGVNPGGGANHYKLTIDSVATATYQPFFITDYSDTAVLEVVSVTDETTAIVKNTDNTEPAIATAFTDLEIVSITYKNTGTNLDYKIGHLATGADLTGTVLVTYTAVRNDLAGELGYYTQSDYEDTLGYPTPANPLAWGLSKVFEVYSGGVYGIQVESDTLSSWQEALTTAADFKVYSIVPCTQTASILALMPTHVNTYSTATEKKHRVGWINHLEVIQETKATVTSYPGTVSYTKATPTTTVVFDAVDVAALGVVVGDVMDASWNDGVGGTGSFTAKRIISVAAATPAVGKSTITILNANGITDPSTGTMTLWSIKSKYPTMEERATAIAEYTQGLNNQRIRNIYPDTCQLDFGDDVGIFGGGTVRVTAWGWLLACTEAAKQAYYAPVQPLTRQAGGSYYRVVDPFIQRKDLQDVIIDGGNYYLEQETLENSPYAIRAISTRVDAEVYTDTNILSQIDYFTRLVYLRFNLLVGNYVNNVSYQTTLMMGASSLIDQVITEGNLRLGSLESLVLDPTTSTFTMNFNITPYAPINVGDITLNISLT